MSGDSHAGCFKRWKHGIFSWLVRTDFRFSIIDSPILITAAGQRGIRQATEGGKPIGTNQGVYLKNQSSGDNGLRGFSDRVFHPAAVQLVFHRDGFAFWNLTIGFWDTGVFVVFRNQLAGIKRR